MADFRSRQPERVEAALRDLLARMDGFDEFPMPPPGLEIFENFGEAVPEATQLQYLKLLKNYSFDPPLSEDDRLDSELELVRKYADPFTAFNVALDLKIAPDPPSAVRKALRRLAEMGLFSPRHAAGASALVSSLLDGNKAVRAASVESLAEWPMTKPAYRQVLDEIRPELTESERARLDHSR